MAQNLPTHLGEQEKQEFLSHFGASSVRCLSSHGKMVWEIILLLAFHSIESELKKESPFCSTEGIRVRQLQ